MWQLVLSRGALQKLFNVWETLFLLKGKAEN